MQQVPPRQLAKRSRGRRRLLVAVLASSAVWTVTSGWSSLGVALPRECARGVLRPSTAGSAFAGVLSSDAKSARSALQSASLQVDALRSQVDAGSVVPGFGATAASILAGLPGDIARALDGSLYALFLRQVLLLRQRHADRFEQEALRGSCFEAAANVDERFAAEAQDLVRPGSSWKFDHQRAVLKSLIEDAVRLEASLMEERALSAREHQTTIDVIGKMQREMDVLQHKAQGMRRGGSPWVLSTSYRIPNTPLQVVGKYEQGRANVQLNLTPTKDPSGMKGLADSVSPASFGASFDLGI
eukprot:TRINITY_DN24811_c0_g1_i1.p1 TRINITY_DN24811_c0_g1~~TRINITY_DN24811_c0_g1_i1.p1  ORF type:complete len:300 (+),score=50.76 TRINITY_DN24811_c0_g1_i1:105-1004(+)